MLFGVGPSALKNYLTLKLVLMSMRSGLRRLSPPRGAGWEPGDFVRSLELRRVSKAAQFGALWYGPYDAKSRQLTGAYHVYRF